MPSINFQQKVGVTLWADGDKRIKAHIREIAAAADPVSRTYRVKATLLEGQDEVRLGMTATVWIPSITPSSLAVPLSAIFTPQNQPEQTSVWLVDERTLYSQSRTDTNRRSIARRTGCSDRIEFRATDCQRRCKPPARSSNRAFAATI